MGYGWRREYFRVAIASGGAWGDGLVWTEAAATSTTVATVEVVELVRVTVVTAIGCAPPFPWVPIA